jgi:hypothetical protein
MSTHPPDDRAHLDDDELLRLLDGEEDAARRDWEAHVAVCAICAESLDSLRRDAGAVHHWLERAGFEHARAGDGVHGLLRAGDTTVHEDADVIELRAAARRPAAPLPSQPRSRTSSMAPWLRAAAVLALLATPVAAIPAFREWIVETVSGRPGELTTEAFTTRDAATDAGIIRFTPAPGAFAVEFAAQQQDGELRITRADGPEAVLQASDEADALPVVSAAALRIRNSADHTGGYTLALPAEVSSVTVRIAGRAVVIERGQIDAGTSVTLR